VFERRRKKVPGLNTTSTADISFMLLIFFLVTSSMDTDKGLPRQLPPPQQEQQKEVELKVKERNVMEIRIDADNQLTCNGEPTIPEALKERIADFVANTANDPTLPEKSIREVNYFGRCEVSDRHVLSIQVDRQTSYDAYFQMQDAIVGAYKQLRNQLALRKFGKPLSRCTRDEREAIGMVYPQRISEEAPTATEGDADQKGGKKS
jgi:biopolymer transport protein ExbD